MAVNHEAMLPLERPSITAPIAKPAANRLSKKPSPASPWAQLRAGWTPALRDGHRSGRLGPTPAKGTEEIKGFPSSWSMPVPGVRPRAHLKRNPL